MALPDGMHGIEGTLEDVLYHGASSRCHVRVDATRCSSWRERSPPAPRRCRARARRCGSPWRPADAVVLEEN